MLNNKFYATRPMCEARDVEERIAKTLKTELVEMGQVEACALAFLAWGERNKKGKDK